MAALVAMLVQPAPDASALQTEAAAKLLNALLGVDVLAAGGDFCAAGGMAALRALISNAPDGPAVRTRRCLRSPCVHPVCHPSTRNTAQGPPTSHHTRCGANPVQPGLVDIRAGPISPWPRGPAGLAHCLLLRLANRRCKRRCSVPDQRAGGAGGAALAGRGDKPARLSPQRLCTARRTTCSCCCHSHHEAAWTVTACVYGDTGRASGGQAANPRPGRQAAQVAVRLLAALVSGGPDSDVEAMAAFADAACAGGLLAPLLELARSAQDSSAEVVRALHKPRSAPQHWAP